MVYLLAKYTFLFLLASILGFVLGYWWSRRKFVDVSESYEDLRQAAQQNAAANWDRLFSRLDALPEPKATDLSAVIERLDGVETAVARIPKPAAIDLAPVESRLESLASKVDKFPAPAKPKDPDLAPLAGRMEKLEKTIHAVPAPVDIEPLGKRLAGLETAVRNIPQPKPQDKVDLQPVSNELLSIRRQIDALPKVETQESVDLAPLQRQIDGLEDRVRKLPQPQAVDLKPIDGRLRSIEAEIDKLGQRLSSAPRTASAPKARSVKRPKPSTGQPKILSAALYGKKDDLKQISGVGPKLERLLNKNGVFYFWQVASWSRSDIEVIDERLDAFKGRILRDGWVSQARELREAPGAASMPAA